MPFFLLSLLVIALTIIGTISFIIPGVIFSTWFYFSGIIIILKETDIISALKTSRNLTKNRFLSVLWKSIVGPLLIFMFYIAGFFIIMTAIALITGQDLSVVTNEGSVITDRVVSQILEIIFIPILILYQTIFYLEAKK